VLGYIAVKLVFAGTAAFAFMQWFFVSYSLKDVGETWCRSIVTVLTLAAVAMICLPRKIYEGLLCTFLCFPRTADDIDDDIDYYDVQKAWAKHQKYHTTNQVYLWMENMYAHPSYRLAPPWDFKTGNIPKPGEPAEPDTAASAGPKPGTLGSVAPGGLEDGEGAASGMDSDEDDVEAPAETAAMASSDPAVLALEEMKFKLDLAALGALPSHGDDTSSEADVSEDDEDGMDTTTPLTGTAAIPGSVKPGMYASIAGLESAAGDKYNGTTCMVIAKDAATGKWRCELEDGQKANLPETKLTPLARAFSPGTKVLLDGLTMAQYNGTEATIVNFDPKKRGYTVKLFTGVKACVKPSNVSALSG
jgi:hypothetical protein